MEEPRPGVIGTNTQVGSTHRGNLNGIATKWVLGDVGSVGGGGVHFWVVGCDVVRFVDKLESVAVQVAGGEKPSAGEGKGEGKIRTKDASPHPN